VLSTLWWWAFAFMPLPSAPPPWLTGARQACFGTVGDGLPGPHGWILLIAAPLSLLAAACALWGGEVLRSAASFARSTPGKLVIVAIASLVIVEGAWVSGKISAARAVGRWDPTVPDQPSALPADYPRRAAPAPDFALLDQHGRSVSLGALRGRPVVVTFVFAHCQAVCPLLLQKIKTATTDRAPVLAVTLDPWRDTPGALPGIARAWALPSHVHVLSAATAPDVTRVIAAFGVPFERDPVTGDIAHPALVFIVDRAGHIAYTFNNPPPAWIRDALARLD
jgi:protein SCO1/2